MPSPPSSPPPSLGRGSARQPEGRTAVVVLAGGSGTRVGSTLNKVYLPLAGRRMLTWSLTWARQVPSVGSFVVVIRPEDADLARRILDREVPGLPVTLVPGGSSRHASEAAAVRHLAPAVARGDVETVVLHDGARPLAGPSLWHSVIATARAVGGAVPALPASGLLVLGTNGQPAPEGERPPGLVRVQTPQAFRAADVVTAFEEAYAASYEGTDTSSTLQAHAKLVIQVVAGLRSNLKITYPQDVSLAEQLLAHHAYRLP